MHVPEDGTKGLGSVGHFGSSPRAEAIPEHEGSRRRAPLTTVGEGPRRLGLLSRIQRETSHVQVGKMPSGQVSTLLATKCVPRKIHQQIAANGLVPTKHLASPPHLLASEVLPGLFS